MVPGSTPLELVAQEAGLLPAEIELHGKGKAKVSLDVLRRTAAGPRGRLVLVTAITPTPAGEGKTVTSIGLVQGLRHTGRRAVGCLRQPSLGPVFGMKGCASGTGRAQLHPREEINLHLTGDFHAVTSAHNLLAACTDNAVQHGNKLGISRVRWRRALDVCDRQLRNIEAGRGGSANGFVHESGFDITAASEVMASLALAADARDLRGRLSRIIVAERADGSPVTAGETKCVGAMMALLRDALRPTLVQSTEGAPVLMHCGPFANIAHGCSSLIATRMALGCSDYVVTEAGFAADLGAEKFVHIKCRMGGLQPSCVVLVASVRALRHHGAGADGAPGTVAGGFPNLRVHAENLIGLGMPVVIALNRFSDDSEDDLAEVRRFGESLGLPVAVSDCVRAGGAGAAELAEAVARAAEPTPTELRYCYGLSDTIEQKVEAVARSIYRADGVDFSPEALSGIEWAARHGYAGLPICMAKTQSSISDDPKRRGAPTGWRLTVREVRVSAGAGFIVALTGRMQLMPGLPERGRFADIDLTDDGEIIGLA